MEAVKTDAEEAAVCGLKQLVHDQRGGAARATASGAGGSGPGSARADGGGGSGSSIVGSPTHSHSTARLAASMGGSRGAVTVSSGHGNPRSRAARAAKSDTVLHPVLRLGWRPLCEVACNGLHGLLLGGHDKDIYVRCLSGDWAARPLLDVAQGGCIMTCSQFEKAAGRELSKKWKESIHVVGEGEGSRATLLNWLKRRAEQDFGAGVVGRPVWVCWCSDGDFHQGTVTSFDGGSGKHRVEYFERGFDDLHLPLELLSFSSTRPQPAAAPAPATAAAVARELAQGDALVRQPLQGQQQQHEQQQQQQPTASIPHFLRPRGPREQAGTASEDDYRPTNPVWNQGSGASVSSSFLDDAGGSGPIVLLTSPAAGSAQAAAPTASAAVVAGLGSFLRRQASGMQAQQPAAKRGRTAAAAGLPASQPTAAPGPAACPPHDSVAANWAAPLAAPQPPSAAPGQQQQQQQHGAAEPGTVTLAPASASLLQQQQQQQQQQAQQQAQQLRLLQAFGSTILTPNDSTDLSPGAATPASTAAVDAGRQQRPGLLPAPPAAGLAACAAEMSAWMHATVLALEDGPGLADQHAVEQHPAAAGLSMVGGASPAAAAITLPGVLPQSSPFSQQTTMQLRTAILQQPDATLAAGGAAAAVEPRAAVLAQCSAAAAGAAGCQGSSLTAGFQALLALARGNESQLRGWYEALLSRYCHFQVDPLLLRQKMVQLIKAALQVAAPAAPLQLTLLTQTAAEGLAAAAAAAVAKGAPRDGS